MNLHHIPKLLSQDIVSIDEDINLDPILLKIKEDLTKDSNLELIILRNKNEYRTKED